MLELKIEKVVNLVKKYLKEIYGQLSVLIVIRNEERLFEECRKTISFC